MSQEKNQRPVQPVKEKDKITLAKEARKWRGKRNSIGAKMAGFRGGSHDFKRSGGGIGDRDLSGKSKSMQHARGGYAPTPKDDKPAQKAKGGKSEMAGRKRKHGKR